MTEIVDGKTYTEILLTHLAGKDTPTPITELRALLMRDFPNDFKAVATTGQRIHRWLDNREDVCVGKVMVTGKKRSEASYSFYRKTSWGAVVEASKAAGTSPTTDGLTHEKAESLVKAAFRTSESASIYPPPNGNNCGGTTFPKVCTRTYWVCSDDNEFTQEIDALRHELMVERRKRK